MELKEALMLWEAEGAGSIGVVEELEIEVSVWVRVVIWFYYLSLDDEEDLVLELAEIFDVEVIWWVF